MTQRTETLPARHRIGIVIAAPGIVSRREMLHLLSDVDMDFEEYRVRLSNVEGNQAIMQGELERAVRALAARDIELIVQIGVAPAAALGPERDHEIRDVYEAATRLPIVIAMEATLAAFAHLGVREPVIIAPLAGGMEDRIPRYFEAHGLRVKGVLTLGLPTPETIHQTLEATTEELARRAIAAAPDADCLYAFGGGLPSVGVLDAIERVLRKPTFSSNTATAWAIRRALGLPTLVPGCGTLLAT